MGCYLKSLSIEPSPRLRGTTAASQATTPAAWVQLAALPNPYSHDQGLLLCRHSDDEWLVWIPDHGEAILHRSEFYFDTDWN